MSNFESKFLPVCGGKGSPHCYCGELQKHLECCMCGHRKLKNSVTISELSEKLMNL